MSWKIRINKKIVPRYATGHDFFPFGILLFFKKLYNSAKIVYNFLYNIGQRFAPY